MESIDKFLSGNRKKKDDDKYFQRLAEGQKPGVWLNNKTQIPKIYKVDSEIVLT